MHWLLLLQDEEQFTASYSIFVQFSQSYLVISPNCAIRKLALLADAALCLVFCFLCVCECSVCTPSPAWGSLHCIQVSCHSSPAGSGCLEVTISLTVWDMMTWSLFGLSCVAPVAPACHVAVPNLAQPSSITLIYNMKSILTWQSCFVRRGRCSLIGSYPLPLPFTSFSRELWKTVTH